MDKLINAYKIVIARMDSLSAKYGDKLILKSMYFKDNGKVNMELLFNGSEFEAKNILEYCRQYLPTKFEDTQWFKDLTPKVWKYKIVLHNITVGQYYENRT